MEKYKYHQRLRNSLDLSIPYLLITNNLILIYVFYTSKNSGDQFWYILVVMLNIGWMILDLKDVWYRKG